MVGINTPPVLAVSIGLRSAKTRDSSSDITSLATHRYCEGASRGRAESPGSMPAKLYWDDSLEELRGGERRSSGQAQGGLGEGRAEAGDML